MRNWVGLLAVVASSCSRCNGPPPPVDAGPVRIHRSTDLKIAVFTAYPEFRGARVMQGIVAFTGRGPETSARDAKVFRHASVRIAACAGREGEVTVEFTPAK